MKAILEFDLPDDEYEYKAASKGKDYLFVLWELDQWLRGEIKYNDAKYTKKEYLLLEKVRQQLRDEMINHNVTFDE